MLTLTEELLLLAIHDDKGTIIFASSANIPYGLGATIILDLVEKNQIILENNKVIFQNSNKTDIDFLDFSLNILKSIKTDPNKNELTLKQAILSLSHKYLEIQNLILDNLVITGILKRELSKFMFMIKFSKYPTLDPAEELKTRDQIYKAVLLGIEPNNRLRTLISLIYICHLIDEVFPKRHRETARKNILEIMESDSISKVVSEIISEVSILIASPIQ
jgi:Golgi phosphoprotein 3